MMNRQAEFQAEAEAIRSRATSQLWIVAIVAAVACWMGTPWWAAVVAFIAGELAVRAAAKAAAQRAFSRWMC